MKYEKAAKILPQYVLEMIQEYVDGTYLYIPRKEGNKKSWGESSGSLKDLAYRNDEIFTKYKEGRSIKELAEMYYLSESSIRRIIKQCNAD